MKKENGSMFKCGRSTFEHSEDIKESNELGRFPSNFIYTGCDEVFDEFSKAGYTKSTPNIGLDKYTSSAIGKNVSFKRGGDTNYTDEGSTSRYFQDINNINLKNNCYEVKVKLMLGDCLEQMKRIPDNYVDSIVTDPPAAIGFMGREWDSDKGGRDFWIKWLADVMTEAKRTLKPGGHCFVWALPRQVGWTHRAIEDAGFEIRDIVTHVFGCLSDDTQILTVDGWKDYTKLDEIMKTSVLNFDINTNTFSFDKPKNKFVYEDQHTAYRIYNNYTDQLLSAGHRVIVERSGKKTFQSADTLQPKENIPFLESLRDLPETIYDRQQNTSITKQELLKRVLNDERNKKQFRTEITQKSEENKSILRMLWSGDNKKRSRIEMVKSLFLFSIMPSKNKSNRQEICEQWSWEEMPSKGVKDGEKSSVERWGHLQESSWSLYWRSLCEMSSRIFGNETQERLCCAAPFSDGSTYRQTFNETGSGSSYRPQPKEQQHNKPYAISNQQRTQNIRGSNATVEQVEYNGTFWCIETTTGAFVARRNGKIFITGNSGFPKSHNISKAIDKQKGLEGEVIGVKENMLNTKGAHFLVNENERIDIPILAPASDEAKQWEGWGTGLKPASEHWILCRKPLTEKTIADNVLKWGVGGINIDKSRVEISKNEGIDFEQRQIRTEAAPCAEVYAYGMNKKAQDIQMYKEEGRFPANFIHDGSDEVMEEFDKAGKSKSNPRKKPIISNRNVTATYNMKDGGTFNITDEGSAARFFFNTNNINKCLCCEYNSKTNNKEKWEKLNINVSNVVSRLKTIKVKEEFIVVMNALMKEKEQKDQDVGSVENLCDICEMYIVAGIVGLRMDYIGEKELQVMLDFIIDYKRCILIQNLVSFVELWANIDTTQTIPNLLKLFGFVKVVITNYTQEMIKLEQNNLTYTKMDLQMKNDPECQQEKGSRFIYVSKASGKEKNEGLDHLEDKKGLGQQIAEQGGTAAIGNHNKTCSICNGSQFDRGKGICKCDEPQWKDVKNNSTKNHHPTVKPIKLMSYLINMITPPNGIVLDPFLGSGSTGVAAVKNNFNFIGIEKEPEYMEIAKARIEYAKNNK